MGRLPNHYCFLGAQDSGGVQHCHEVSIKLSCRILAALMGTSWMHYFIKKFNCLKFPSGYSLCSLHHRHCLYYFEVNVLSIHALGIFVCVEFLLLFNSYILKVTIRRFKKSTSVLPTYLRFFLTLK